MLRFAAVPIAVGLLFFVSGLPGCLESTSSSTGLVVPTLLTVDPATFRGAVVCGAPGLEKYVVTLTDVTAGGSAPLASSQPTSCTTLTSFGTPAIQQNHFYVAAIDGYDRADLTQAPGSRTLTDPNTGEVVPPRWTTICGQPALTLDAAIDSDSSAAAPTSTSNPLLDPTQVQGSVEVHLRGCLPLSPVVAGIDQDAGSDVTSDAMPNTDSAPLAPASDAEDSSIADGATPTDVSMQPTEAAEVGDAAADGG